MNYIISKANQKLGFYFRRKITFTPTCLTHIWGSFKDDPRSLEKLSSGFFQPFRVIFRVSEGFVGLLGSVIGLWSVLQFFVTACVSVSCAIDY